GDEQAAVDVDLGDPLHPRPEPLGVVDQPRLDPEYVPPVLLLGDRRDLLDHETERLTGKRGGEYLALLPNGDVGHLALIDGDVDAVAVEGGDFEEHPPARHRRAD